MLDNAKTLMHALRGYYGKQLKDPITLVTLLHLVLTLVHFIVWASTYGGVNGNGPSNVSTILKKYCIYNLRAIALYF